MPKVQGLSKAEALGVLELREGAGAQILDVLEVSRDDLRRKAKAVPPSQD